MLQKLAIVLVLFGLGCSHKPSYTSNANNTEFNTRYKNQLRTIPLQNMYHIDDKSPLIHRGYQYYAQKIDNLEERYQENARYFDFLSKNNFVKMKNITVEKLPKKNYEYIKLARGKTAGELNKLSKVEIEYVLFVKQAMLAKLNFEYHGDPIMHPLAIEQPERSDRHIVMGDEYARWNSICDVGAC